MECYFSIFASGNDDEVLFDPSKIVIKAYQVTITKPSPRGGPGTIIYILYIVKIISNKNWVIFRMIYF